MAETKPFKVTLSEADEYQPILTGRPQSCGMRSGRQALGPHVACGEHSTKAHEEVLVILAGHGIVRMTVAGDYPVRAGEVLYVPPHTEHNVVAGEEGLRYVYVVAPIDER